MHLIAFLMAPTPNQILESKLFFSSYTLSKSPLDGTTDGQIQKTCRGENATEQVYTIHFWIVVKRG